MKARLFRLATVLASRVLVGAVGTSALGLRGVTWFPRSLVFEATSIQERVCAGQKFGRSPNAALYADVPCRDTRTMHLIKYFWHLTQLKGLTKDPPRPSTLIRYWVSESHCSPICDVVVL